MNSLDKRYAPEFWIEHRPCDGYDPDENGSYHIIYELYGCNETLSLREIFDRTDIPNDDKIWCATRDCVLTRDEIGAVLEIIVTRAINNAKSLGIACNEWNAWAEKWLSGEDRSWESADAAAAYAAIAAAYAALAAARAVAAAALAARAAALAAARAVAAAAYVAARAAALAAAAYVAAAVAYTAADSETAKQLRDIINVCDGGRK